jgi:hypothetical protein
MQEWSVFPCFLRLNVRCSELGPKVCDPRSWETLGAEIIPEYNVVSFMLDSFTPGSGVRVGGGCRLCVIIILN